jgi:hypothetical protein
MTDPAKEPVLKALTLNLVAGSHEASMLDMHRRSGEPFPISFRFGDNGMVFQMPHALVVSWNHDFQRGIITADIVEVEVPDDRA